MTDLTLIDRYSGHFPQALEGGQFALRSQNPSGNHIESDGGRFENLWEMSHSVDGWPSKSFNT